MRVLVFCLLCLLYSPALGQFHYSVRHYTTRDGLPQNSVNQIIQDEEGYIWLGTQDGLARFDGYHFTTFRPDPDDPYAIPDNFVIHLQEDNNQNLWITTRKGLSKYERKTDRFYTISVPASDRQYPIRPYLTEIFNDSIWFIFDDPDRLQGLSIYTELTDGLSVLDKLPTKKIVVGEAYLHQFQWIDSSLFVFSYQDRTSKAPVDWQEVSLPSNSENFYLSKKSFLAVGDDVFLSGNYGSFRLDKQSRTVEEIFPNLEVLTFCEWRQGYLLGCTDGIYWARDMQSRPTKVHLNGKDLDNTRVASLLVDDKENLWIGTANEGLFLHNQIYDQFESLNPQVIDPELDPLVWDSFTRDSILIVGTNSGALHLNLKNQRKQTFFTNKRISSVYIDKQKWIWLGDHEGNLYFSKNGESFQPADISIRPGSDVSDIIQDSEGHLWVATHFGLFRSISLQQKTKLVREHFEPSTYFLKFGLTKRNQLLIGHNNGFSKRAADESWQHYKYMENSEYSPNFYFVNGFTEVGDTLYCATYGGGISRLNPDGTFTNFTEKQGLSNNLIHGLAADQAGKLWMSSNGGISIFDTKTGKITNLGRSQGVKSSNFALGSMDISQPGFFRIGTSEGLLLIQPKQTQISLPSPEIKFEFVQVNYTRKNPLHRTSTLTILPADRVTNFYFTALNFIDPEDVRYKYQLVGFDDQWVTLTPPNRNASYSSLPAGDYVLTVQAESSANLFTPRSTQLAIKVLPPFWQRPVFYLTISICFLSLVISSVYFLSRRNLKRKLKELEFKQKIQSERERISRDLHDSVGTHFTYIISQLDFLQMGWHTKHISDKKHYLENLTSFARSGMQMLRETIWALNQAEIPCQSLKIKIEDYLKLCFQSTEAKYQFHCNFKTDTVNSTIALNSFRIIQESVNNALKHANCTQIEINLELNDFFLITIQDNGKGFEVNRGKEKTGHFGLKNLEKRASEMNSKFEITSSDKGTEIRIYAEK